MLEKIRAILGVLSIISVLVLCITMPLTAFSITDYKLLGSTENAVITYQSAALSEEDFYILKSLNLSYQKRFASDQYTFDNTMFTTPNVINEMTFNSELANEVEMYLYDLNKAGAVPDTIFQEYSFIFRDNPVNGKVVQGYFSSSASGIALMNVYLVDNSIKYNSKNIVNEELICSLTVEMKSNKVLSLLYLSQIDTNALAVRGANECFIKYLGLDVAQDWQDTSDLILANKSLYSPSLGLVTMLDVGDNYKNSGAGENYFSLKLMPVEQNQISLREQYNASLVPHPIEELEPAQQKIVFLNKDVSMINDTTYGWNEQRLFTSTDEKTRQAKILCSKPNCTHDNETCDALLSTSVYMQKVLPINEKIYIIKFESKSKEPLESPQKQPDCELQIVNYNPQTNTYEDIAQLPITTRGTILGYDEASIYVYDMIKCVSEIYYQIEKITLETPQKSEVIKLAPGEGVTGSYGKYFVTTRKEGINDLWADSNGPKEFLQIQLENKDKSIVLLDFDTQKRIPLQLPKNSENILSCFFYQEGDFLYMRNKPNGPPIVITLKGEPFIVSSKAKNNDYNLNTFRDFIYLSTLEFSYIINQQTGELSLNTGVN